MAGSNGMYIITSWAIKEGKLPDFKQVIDEMIKCIHEYDRGAHFIDYYLSDDEKTSFGVEFYDTPDDYVLAAELVLKWVPELDAASTAKQVWVLGEITPAVRKVLEGWDYVHGSFMTGYFDAGKLPWGGVIGQARKRADERRGGVG